MTHYALLVHKNRDKKLMLIMDDSIDYCEGDQSGSTWIYFRGGNAVEVEESLEEICAAINKLQRDDTRSEQERWLNGE